MADPRIAKIAATLNAAAAAARITIKAQLDTIGDAAVAEVAQTLQEVRAAGAALRQALEAS